jgi:hypothetical protein
MGPGHREMHPMEIPTSPWEVMSWDMIGPLLESRTYNAIITMVDVKSKAIKLELVDITITAMGAMVVMKNRVFREEGLPRKVISDWGPQFVSGFMKELYHLLGIEANLSTAYHPKTDGKTERVNREVEKYLRMFTNYQQDGWADWLPLAEFAYNNAIHEATGQTPFFLNKGPHPQALPDEPVMETTVGDFLSKIKDATCTAKKSLQKAKIKMKKRWDANRRKIEDFTEGSLVLVSTDHLPSN